MPRRNNTPKPNRYQSPPMQCRGKQRYASKNIAKQVIEDRQNLLDDEVSLASYRCPSCQGWHLTSAI